MGEFVMTNSDLVDFVRMNAFVIKMAGVRIDRNNRSGQNDELLPSGLIRIGYGI